MKIIITESQYKFLTENFDSVLDIYSKKNKGETLKPSELDVLKVFNNYVKKGGTPEEFVFNQDDVYGFDEREGMLFNYTLKGRPLQFEFTEETETENDIEYFGEITFDGDEYLGVIVTDKNGYLIDYDFYSTLTKGDVRLQELLIVDNSDAEFRNFLQEMVINVLINEK
jgi:hypothetical protein